MTRRETTLRQLAHCPHTASQECYCVEMAIARGDRAEAAEAVSARLRELTEWQPIETAPKDKTLVLVALIRDGVVWRASDAVFNGLGWYTKNGKACHWRTHWMPLPKPDGVLVRAPHRET